MIGCAVCQLSDGLIINIIVAEPTDLPPSGCELVETPDAFGNNAIIGGMWNGIVFISPGVNNGH